MRDDDEDDDTVEHVDTPEIRMGFDYVLNKCVKQICAGGEMCVASKIC